MNDPKTYTVNISGTDFNVGFQVPERLPQPGDIYEFTRVVSTLASVAYNVGDTVEILERTSFAPHNRKSSLGNLLIKCRFMTSVWTEFDDAVAKGTVRLVSSKKAPTSSP